MDDGMQFAGSKEVGRTAPQYVVAATSKRGNVVIVSCCGTENREEAAQWMADAEAQNSEWSGKRNFHLRVWLPEHKFMDEAMEER